mgnify:CR=1 FL=1
MIWMVNNAIFMVCNHSFSCYNYAACMCSLNHMFLLLNSYARLFMEFPWTEKEFNSKLQETDQQPVTRNDSF